MVMIILAHRLKMHLPVEELNSSMNLEQTSRECFASINRLLGWISTATSPLRFYYAIFSQQKYPGTDVPDLEQKHNIVTELQKYKNSIKFPRLCDVLTMSFLYSHLQMSHLQILMVRRYNCRTTSWWHFSEFNFSLPIPDFLQV